MGIGNCVLRYRWRRCLSDLITPHGDRKLASRWSNKTGHISLITPHGDRKLLGIAGCEFKNQVLITPHGDRKQH